MTLTVMRLAAILLVAAAAGFGQERLAAPALRPLSVDIEDKRDIRIGPAERNADPPVLWTGEIVVPDVPYIRLFLRIEGSPFPPASRVILFGANDLRTELELETIGDGYWTDLLPFGRVRLAVVTGDGALAPDSVFVIDSLSYRGDTVFPYSFHLGNQLARINSASVPEAIRKFARPVAYLSFKSSGLPGSCTGFLIGRDMILTNEHCINDAEGCASLVVTFGWEQDADGRLRFGNQFRCAGFNPRLSNFELDVTAVRLKGNPGDEYGIIDLTLADDSLTGPMVIIQHSGVVPKEVSIEGCAMIAAPVNGRGPATDFTHTCDTAEGSSGAPILDVNGHFRGLHHFGFKDDDSDIWDENRGVQGMLILEWLEGALAVMNEVPVHAGK
jgi:Trypsin-like peptidase domain